MIWLQEITAPKLIIGGKEAWIMPPDQGAKRRHAGSRYSRLVIFENSGHFPFIEEQEPFLKIVGDWIAGLTERQI
ncbi:MAG: hypothetical protein HGA43_10450 [Nitrospirae bacterium]|nr:hypothetical protein [Nitrospirota bacterium]